MNPPSSLGTTSQPHEPQLKPTYIVGVGGLAQPSLEALELGIRCIPQRLERQRRQVPAHAVHRAQRLWDNRKATAVAASPKASCDPPAYCTCPPSLPFICRQGMLPIHLPGLAR